MGICVYVLNHCNYCVLYRLADYSSTDCRLGNVVQSSLSPTVIPALNSALTATNSAPLLEGQKVSKCFRISIKSAAFFSSGYKCRNSYTVEYSTEGQLKYGVVLYFVFPISRDDVPVTFVLVKHLVQKVVYINFGGGNKYVCMAPNNYVTT